jgi:riboflavin kinase/FMN adenylyltransferase
MRRHKLPFTGVYAVRVRDIDVNLARDAVASLGFRPTVAGTEPLLEVHVFDYAGSLYGREAGSGVRREDPRRGKIRQPR